VRKLRKKQKVSQEALAEKAGIHRTYMGKMSVGKAILRSIRVQRLQRQLKISLSDLF